MTAPGLIILITLAFVLALIYMELGGMPGKMARERGHPQANAINVLGWIGLLLGVMPWLVALTWANVEPGRITTLPSAEPEASGDESKQDSP